MERPSKKSTTKSVSEKEPVLTQALITRLPADALRDIALASEYPDILHWCRTAKKFNTAICNEPNFWIRKLERDFPVAYANLIKRGPEIAKRNAKDTYGLAFSQELEDKATKIITTATKDPRVRKINKELKELKKTEKALKKEKEKFIRQIEDEGFALREQAFALRKTIHQRTPRKPGKNYIDMRVKFNEGMSWEDDLTVLEEAVGSKSYERKKTKFLDSIIKALHERGEELTDGTLIGITNKEEIDTVPEILIYIYSNDKGEFDIETIMTNITNYISKFLKDNIDDIGAYNLPFEKRLPKM
jgi:hypothetical protein